MTSTLRHISFRHLGTTEVHQRFLEGDRDLGGFLGLRARSVEELLKRAPTGAERVIPRDELVASLTAYADRYDAPPQVYANIEALRDPETHVVVTGQQPGLLGGPLFCLHKAATAIRLCDEIQRQGGPKCVPLFWNHSDDHDLAEGNRAFLINQSQEVQRFRLDLNTHNEALREIRIGREVERLLEEVKPLLPNSEFHADLLETLTPTHPDDTLGALQARIMFEAFGRHGLMVIEPRDLPDSAFEPLERWWTRSQEIRDLVNKTCDDLHDLGVDITLDPAATMMFAMNANRREPLADGEDYGEARNLSPGVLLRPLWQDACLPTIGFVVGPGELSYLSAVAPLYRLLGVPKPVFVPRSSLTIVDPSTQRALQRFELDLPDLSESPERLAERLLQGEGGRGGDIEGSLDNIKHRLRNDLDAVEKQLQTLDASMTGALDRARSKAIDEIERLQNKVRNARQNREGTGIKQLRRLCNSLRPRARMQERVFGPITYLNAYGPRLADELIGAADPFTIDHGVLEL
ncbi:MAG: bacillithiol biosynthesis BshC [Planctomycetota bacterium]|nr:bacillithiol biosynthesis BshC [Planctomycetota bacterium]